ncbi:GTP cyclohydrolase II [Streptomyces sp. NPDC012751]|uniref:GTP cyclohydrolase II n=1 Tax=Streptomyces sp. NPDC012751 TaxID=3364846 RepID=UPI0036AB9B35
MNQPRGHAACDLPATVAVPPGPTARPATPPGHWTTLPAASVRTVVRLPIDVGTGEPVLSQAVTFSGLVDHQEHIAIRLGPDNPVPLVRLHSECLTGDVLGSARCDCGPQLREALRHIGTVGGVLVYLRQEGRGIGLYNKLDAYLLQERGMDTFEANRALGLGEDLRDYSAAAQILRALGHTEIDLLTNNPDKRSQLTDYGVAVRRTVGTGVFANPHNAAYLMAKVVQTSHSLQLEENTA